MWTVGIYWFTYIYDQIKFRNQVTSLDTNLRLVWVIINKTPVQYHQLPIIWSMNIHIWYVWWPCREGAHHANFMANLFLFAQHAERVYFLPTSYLNLSFYTNLLYTMHILCYRYVYFGSGQQKLNGWFIARRPHVIIASCFCCLFLLLACCSIFYI